MTVSKRQQRRAGMLCLLIAAVSLVQSNGQAVVESDAIVSRPKRLRNEHNPFHNNMNDAKAKTITPSPPHELRRRLTYANHKWVPDKGDTTDCQSIIDHWREHLEDNQESDRLPPCRNGTIVDEYGDVIEEPPNTGTAFVPGSDNGSGNFPPGVAVPELLEHSNAVSVGLAVALSPESGSHRLIVTRVITTTLNESVDEIDFFVSHRRQLYDIDGKGNEDLPDGTLRDAEVPLNEDGRLPQFPPQVASPKEEEFELNGTTALYDLFYQRTTVRAGHRNDQRWYYRYDFVYLCFRKDSGLPITNQTLLQSITDNLNATLEQLISSGIIRSRIMDEAREAVLNVSLFEEMGSEGGGVEEPSASAPFNPPSAPSVSSMPSDLPSDTPSSIPSAAMEYKAHHILQHLLVRLFLYL
jgi:hypothetical protein